MSKIISNILLEGLSGEELREIERLNCFRKKRFMKDEIIFHAGDSVRDPGIVLEGKVLFKGYDPMGKMTILNSIPAEQIFAETYAILGTPILVDAVAGENSLILFIKIRTLLSDAFASASWQPKLMRNLLNISVRKNLVFSTRIYCTSPNGTRQRIITFLSGFATQYGSEEFDIPFSRQEMADYLNLDRSALSRELGRMRDEGLIAFRKNHFRFLIK